MPSIGFLSPWFLAGLLAVSIPIVLHLFRRRVDPVVPFSAVRLLRQAPVQQARRRRLQDLLLLALRVAALLLLAIAFARPYLASSEAQALPPVTAIFVDTSASLDAPGRFDRARALAREAIDTAPRGHEVAVGRFAGRADLLVAPTPDRAVARATLDALEPSSAATRYEGALARASEAIGDRGGRVVLVTDLQGSGWRSGRAATLPPGVELDVRDVGPLPPNAGVTGVERTPQGVRATVRNTGPARTLRVAAALDDGAPTWLEVPARADAVEMAAFELALPERGVLTVRVEDPEGLRADNVRWMVLDPRPARRIRLIVAPGDLQREGFYTARALEAMERVRSFDVDLQPADRVSAAAVAEGVSAVGLLGTAGLDRRAVERLGRFVREGGGLFIAAGPSVNADLLAAELGTLMPSIRAEPEGDEPLAMAPSDLRHPVFRVFAETPGAFDSVRFTRVATVLGGTGSRVLARFDNGAPALVEQPVDRGRVAVFASDVGNRWNDFALHPSFVPFIAETFAWLSGVREAPDALVAGETGLADADTPGVVDWRAPGEVSAPVRRVAVNADPGEFEPAREALDAFRGHVQEAEERAAAGVARRQEAEQGLWWYGLGLMLLSLVVESAIGRRG